MFFANKSPYVKREISSNIDRISISNIDRISICLYISIYFNRGAVLIMDYENRDIHLRKLELRFFSSVTWIIME